jgi:hypothetical protein
LLPTLFTVVNNIEKYCYTRFGLNNIVQYCWQVWTTWAAKHCTILLSSGLGVFCRVGTWRQHFDNQSWRGSGYAFLGESTFCLSLFCAPTLCQLTYVEYTVLGQQLQVAILNNIFVRHTRLA